MRIEKNFYSEEAEQWERAERAAGALESRRSEEEREEQNRQRTFEADELLSQREMKAKETYQVIPQEKLDRFGELTKRALTLAEMAPMDIIVDTEHFFGRIWMSADCFMIQPSSPASMRTDFAALIEEAESVTITPGKDGRIEMTLLYPFCSEVSRKG
ncbi:MAG: hypothetical protein LUI13_07795 [Lachnospiraceae bacterium]|nr:hypothetical protein [Lachnospiraceae bacterium]